MKALFYSIMLLTCSVYAAPKLMLAQEFTGQDIQGWAMSEKLDGVRAFWDGKQLISRQGYAFTPPKAFTQNFPGFPMDGELFRARGEFEQLSAAVRSQNGDWRGIKLYVFDVPQAKGTLYQRLSVAKQHLQHFPKANFAIIEQIPVQNEQEARQFLHQVEQMGREGVMLRNPNLPYQSGRVSQLLKLKSSQDDECVITQHHEGKGKYKGMLGAVSCKNKWGEFRIGSGFKDADRKNPPKIGTTITFKYRGFTQKGLPRFATYWRKR